MSKETENKEKTEYNIFDNPDQLIKIWENERITRNYTIDLMWQNVKYFGTVFGALLVAHMALLGFLWPANGNSMLPFTIRVTVLIFPVSIIALSFYANSHLKLLHNRFLLVVTHLLKLEDILGLHNDISQILPHFKQDKYLFPKYKENLKFATTDEFIHDQNQMNSRKSAFKLMGHIYWITTLIALVLIGLDIFILCSDWNKYISHII